MSEKKQTILVVDDEQETVDSLFDTFVDKYHTMKAVTAKKALEIINDNQIDIVVCDQVMPEMTGVELFEKIKKDFPDIGKIILTGYLEDKVVLDAINKGSVDKSVIKPWDADDILNIVHELMNTKHEKTD